MHLDDDVSALEKWLVARGDHASTFAANTTDYLLKRKQT